MADSSQPKILLDGLTSFELGMNSGILPHLLSANQTAFSTNCTHRSGFITHRPPVRKMALNFKGDVSLENSVRYGLFQGQCFFKSEFSEEGIVASISGRIFFFVYKTTEFEVRDVTPKTGLIDDPNSATATVAWLWQSERWVIINDGLHLPIFFDGLTTRRSLGIDLITIAITTVNFNAPVIGTNIELTIDRPYDNAIGIQVLIGIGHYEVVSFRNSGLTAYKLTMLENSGPTGTVYPDDMQLKVPSAFVAQVADTQPSPPWNPAGPLAFGQTFSITGWFQNQTAVVRISHPYTGGLNEIYILESVVGNLSVEVVGVANAGLDLTLKILTATNGSLGIKVGAFFGKSGVTWSTIATAKTFNAPGPGNNVTINITGPYTGSIGMYVYSSDSTGEFIVQSAAFDPTLTYYVTVKNIDDVAATVHNAPTTIFYRTYELPAGRMGAYGMGRNWECLPDGRSFIASDIVGSPESGTQAYQFRDSVLNIRENTFLDAGGVFVIPGQVGDITSMTFTANLDTSLGQGPLQVGTATTIFSCNAPVNRATWQTLENPILTESLKGRGPLGQYGTLNVNSDTLFRSQDGLSSLVIARRDFQSSSWGNVPISREVQRIIDQDTKALLGASTATNFDNRFLVGCFPVQGPFGVYHRGMIALNLDPVSTLRGKVDSIYDGLWTGLNVFQFCTGSFSGTYRTFAFCFDSSATRIELFEILPSGKENLFDNDTIGITWSFETPVLFKQSRDKGQFDQVRLLDGEMYLSEIRGPIYVQVWYRPEFSECWTPWHSFQICADNANSTDPKQYRTAIGLGQPSVDACDPTNDRPYRIGNNFQLRFQITGSCKFMGVMCKAVSEPAPQFLPPICNPVCNDIVVANCNPCLTLPNCVRFGLVFYSINAGRTYVNDLMCFDVTESDGTIINICVPPGTISYTNPYGNDDPNDPSGTGDPGGPGNPTPPLTLRCTGGGVVTRTVPPNATPAEIMDIINQMIRECAHAWSDDPGNRDKGSPPPPGGGGTAAPSNDTVYFVHACTLPDILTYTGTLPGWITIDTVNSRLAGAAGTFFSNSKASANAIAQAALNGWANQQLAALTLVCTPPCPAALTGASNNIVGLFNPTITFHPGTSRLWVTDVASFNVYIVDAVAPYTVLTTVDLTAFTGAYQIVYDSKNDQMVILCNNGAMAFYNPSTYGLNGSIAAVVAAGGLNEFPMSYDYNRGYMLVVAVEFGSKTCKLVDCLSRAVLHSNPQPSNMGSPVYSGDTDRHYISYQNDPDLQEVHPTTMNFQSSGINFGATVWITRARYFPAIKQIWASRKDGIANKTGVVLGTAPLAILGVPTGADINPAGSSFSDFIYSCDNIVYMSQFATGILAMDPATYLEISLNAVDTGTNSMTYDIDQNAAWFAQNDFVKTP